MDAAHEAVREAPHEAVDEIELPPLPWARPRRRHRPRPALSQEAIVEAALRIVEEAGADALTMRRVASSLGVAAASLYGHVADKEELVQLLLDRVFAEMPVPDVSAPDWQEELRSWFTQCRSILKRHPGVAGLTLGRIPVGAHAMVRMEALIGIGRRAGLPDRVVAYAGDLFGTFLGGYVHEEDTMAKTGLATDSEEFERSFRDWLLALPDLQFPNMRALADSLASGSMDDRFDWGVDVILRGIASFASRAHRA